MPLSKKPENTKQNVKKKKTSSESLIQTVLSNQTGNRRSEKKSQTWNTVSIITHTLHVSVLVQLVL